jgi:hypothetical protein
LFATTGTPNATTKFTFEPGTSGGGGVDIIAATTVKGQFTHSGGGFQVGGAFTQNEGNSNAGIVIVPQAGSVLITTNAQNNTNTGITIAAGTAGAGKVTFDSPTVFSKNAAFDGGMSNTGNVSTTGGTNPATPVTGVDMWTTGGFSRLALTDTAGAAGHKVGMIQYTAGAFGIGFGADAYNGMTSFIAATGGINAITGITSNSGSGNWTHTGNFEVTNENHSITASGAKGTVSLQSVSQGGGVVSFFDSTRAGNDHVAEWIWYDGSLSARFLSDAGGLVKVPLSISGGQALGITGITSDSGTGAWAHTGLMTVDGNFYAKSQSHASATGAQSGPTNSGAFLQASTNYAAVGHWDQTRTTNNRYADWMWSNGKYQMRFMNDAANAGVFPITITGGQATGITAIETTSGSGAWEHTGDFKASRFVFTGEFTIANLPAASTALRGARAYVTDGASGVTYGSAVGPATGALYLPVFCNGTAWIYA